MIVAKLRGGTPIFRTVLSEDESDSLDFKKPKESLLSDAEEYNPMINEPGASNWYYVVLSAEQLNHMIDPYLDAVNYGLEQIAQPEFNDINVLFRVKGRKLTFTRVSPAAKIQEKGKQMLVFGESSVQLQQTSFAIDFSGELHAYFDGHNRIYFQKFTKAKPLFKHFDTFHKEACYERSEEFLDADIFAVSDIDVDQISISDINKIAAVYENPKMDLDNPQIMARIQDYVQRYPLSGVKLNSDGRIKIATKEDLKCALALLTERYYTAEVTGEVMEARSAQKMKDHKPENKYSQFVEQKEQN